MNVITLHEDAFYQLIETVIARIRAEHKDKPDRWVSSEECMRILRIKSKTTLQKLRDTGAVRFSQPEVGGILYDVLSIHEYLEKFAYDTFKL